MIKNLAGMIPLLLLISGCMPVTSNDVGEQVVIDESSDNGVLEQEIVVEETSSEEEVVERIGNKFCNVAEDCGLMICSGCYSREFLKDAPPDLPCLAYEGYSCACVENRCVEVR